MPSFLRRRAKFGDRIQRAERIGNVNHRENFHPRREQRIEFGQIQQALVAGDGQVGDFCAGALGEQLPRHEIAVMLHFCEQNHIAGFEIFRAPGRGDEVDGLRRAARENDFFGALRVDESGRPLPRRLVSRRGAVAQFMDAAMDVRVVALVIMHQRVNHRARFLRRGGVVEINQRLAVDLLVEDRKILSQCGPLNFPCVTHRIDFQRFASAITSLVR